MSLRTKHVRPNKKCVFNLFFVLFRYLFNMVLYRTTFLGAFLGRSIPLLSLLKQNRTSAEGLGHLLFGQCKAYVTTYERPCYNIPSIAQRYPSVILATVQILIPAQSIDFLPVVWQSFDWKRPSPTAGWGGSGTPPVASTVWPMEGSRLWCGGCGQP